MLFYAMKMQDDVPVRVGRMTPKLEAAKKIASRQDDTTLSWVERYGAGVVWFRAPKTKVN